MNHQDKKFLMGKGLSKVMVSLMMGVVILLAVPGSQMGLAQKKDLAKEGGGIGLAAGPSAVDRMIAQGGEALLSGDQMILPPSPNRDFTVVTKKEFDDYVQKRKDWIGTSLKDLPDVLEELKSYSNWVGGYYRNERGTPSTVAEIKYWEIMDTIERGLKGLQSWGYPREEISKIRKQLIESLQSGRESLSTCRAKLDVLLAGVKTVKTASYIGAAAIGGYLLLPFVGSGVLASVVSGLGTAGLTLIGGSEVVAAAGHMMGAVILFGEGGAIIGAGIESAVGGEKSFFDALVEETAVKGGEALVLAPKIGAIPLITGGVGAAAVVARATPATVGKITWGLNWLVGGGFTASMLHSGVTGEVESHKLLLDAKKSREVGDEKMAHRLETEATKVRVQSWIDFFFSGLGAYHFGKAGIRAVVVPAKPGGTKTPIVAELPTHDILTIASGKKVRVPPYGELIKITKVDGTKIRGWFRFFNPSKGGKTGEILIKEEGSGQSISVVGDEIRNITSIIRFFRVPKPTTPRKGVLTFDVHEAKRGAAELDRKVEVRKSQDRITAISQRYGRAMEYFGESHVQMTPTEKATLLALGRKVSRLSEIETKMPTGKWALLNKVKAQIEFVEQAKSIRNRLRAEARLQELSPELLERFRKVETNLRNRGELELADTLSDIKNSLTLDQIKVIKEAHRIGEERLKAVTDTARHEGREPTQKELTYTPKEIRDKMKILKRQFKDPEERRAIMSGVAGKEIGEVARPEGERPPVVEEKALSPTPEEIAKVRRQIEADIAKRATKEAILERVAQSEKEYKKALDYFSKRHHDILPEEKARLRELKKEVGWMGPTQIEGKIEAQANYINEINNIRNRLEKVAQGIAPEIPPKAVIPPVLEGPRLQVPKEVSKKAELPKVKDEELSHTLMGIEPRVSESAIKTREVARAIKEEYGEKLTVDVPVEFSYPLADGGRGKVKGEFFSLDSEGHELVIKVDGKLEAYVFKEVRDFTLAGERGQKPLLPQEVPIDVLKVGDYIFLPRQRVGQYVIEPKAHVVEKKGNEVIVDVMGYEKGKTFLIRRAMTEKEIKGFRIEDIEEIEIPFLQEVPRNVLKKGDYVLLPRPEGASRHMSRPRAYVVERKGNETIVDVMIEDEKGKPFVIRRPMSEREINRFEVDTEGKAKAVFEDYQHQRVEIGEYIFLNRPPGVDTRVPRPRAQVIGHDGKQYIIEVYTPTEEGYVYHDIRPIELYEISIMQPDSEGLAREFFEARKASPFMSEPKVSGGIAHATIGQTVTIKTKDGKTYQSKLVGKGIEKRWLFGQPTLKNITLENGESIDVADIVYIQVHEAAPKPISLKALAVDKQDISDSEWVRASYVGQTDGESVEEMLFPFRQDADEGGNIEGDLLRGGEESALALGTNLDGTLTGMTPFATQVTQALAGQFAGKGPAPSTKDLCIDMANPDPDCLLEEDEKNKEQLNL